MLIRKFTVKNYENEGGKTNLEYF